MSQKSKYKGIDSREIKCCSDEPNSIEAGISFEEEFLLFHFLEYNFALPKWNQINQVTKSMKLNKKSCKQLIDELKQLSKRLKS